MCCGDGGVGSGERDYSMGGVRQYCGGGDSVVVVVCGKCVGGEDNGSSS